MIRLPISIEGLGSMRASALIFAGAVLLASFSAHADAAREPTAAERSMAAALFDQGRTLMNDGKLDEACAKLTESQRLDPGGGTLLNLALCHEKQGKIATAWTEFREARAIAKRDNRPDRESAADGEIAKIEPQLFKVSIVVAPDVKVPGIVIEIDGTPLPEAGWGTPFPVDPGMRAIVVRAPGYKEWQGSVEAAKTAGTADVNIPKLEKLGPSETKPPPGGSATPPVKDAPPPPPIKSTEPDAPMSSMRKAGFVVGGIGVAVLGIGAVTGVVAKRKNDEADVICGDGSPTCPSDAGYDASQKAYQLAQVSTATFIVGLAGIGAGAIMIAMSPKNAPVKTSLSIGPQFVSITGKF